ncbi:hyaluronan synthase 1-like [Callorhinchus milii]|uniref:hyaluronan synthase 1-like n=1 Tax=Callorhinchus milii TaxID=7868 RepID=UPI001C3F5558|nr:hyaluronan synthase 1-like [Callorhinchus milii]
MPLSLCLRSLTCGDYRYPCVRWPRAAMVKKSTVVSLVRGAQAGLLGVFAVPLSVHLLIQSFFALLECSGVREKIGQCSFTKSVAVAISAYREDPLFLTQCLNSIRDINYPCDKLKVILVIDGNSKEDQYMMDIFREVFCKEEMGTFVWQGNYHARNFNQVKEDPEERKDQRRLARDPVNLFYGESCVGNPERVALEALIQAKRCVCVMQKWGGKREVMYTAFKAIGCSVDYIQVCDSDTKLDPEATMELVKVLESNESYGAVGGEVRVLNPNDSFLSFLSSLCYWLVFNVERACQSYFHCVSCISSPLGLYKNDLLQKFLESWYNQHFLGGRCTFGDDRHLTNQVLHLGYSTKQTLAACCYTETPAQYLRWLNQQIRWSKSYIREWLYSTRLWHKHHLWMTYEAMVVGGFPFLVTLTVVKLFFSGCLWNIVWILLFTQLLGVLKGVYASCLRGDLAMIFTSVYSILYLTSLLPTKSFALLTVTASNWGTSGRKERATNCMPLLPLLFWAILLLVGVLDTTLKEAQDSWAKLPWERTYLMYGSGSFIAYLTAMLVFYQMWSCHKHQTKTATYQVEV